MSSIKISQLTEKATMDGSEELLINDSGTSKKMTTQPILDAQAAAETAQTAAETAQTGAETAETNAASSASAASTSASNASSSASAASASETAAASSASAAQAAEDAALAALDNFDDRYLGVKTSDPTVDNDGDALVAGALYYNSTDDVMKVYDGSSWVAAYASLSGTLVASNNLSDLTNASTARTNLGVVIGTDVQAYSSVLAGTTASFTTADETKLDGIETSATADQTGAEIKTAYESEADTNAFTDAEKTKLSGIETGADVTDTANVTSAGALMDSEVTNLAQVKAFDSADYATAAQGTTADSALQNVSEDTTPQLGGDLQTNSNDIYFGDDDLARFGASSDLYIKHDGSNSYIVEQGTGALVIRGSTQIRLQNVAGTENYAVFNDNGACEFYYNGSKKIETTNTGTTVTGDVTVSGTVDGRDVATDGTKLDGIESGATADQTASEILTLLKTVDGSGSGLDADTLDGLSGGQFLRSDATDYKTSGNLAFSDNVQAHFGTNSDLKIYHDGSNSYIYDTGTGDLRIKGANVALQQASDGSNQISFADGGAVTLAYAGTDKLATTSTGVSVTGDVSASSVTTDADASQKVTIGRYSSGAPYGYIKIGSTASGLRVTNAANTIDLLQITNSNGDLHAEGDVIAYSTTISDERLKENIQPIDDALAKVKQLKGCTFTYTADGKESAGLIAQDVEKVLPSAVTEKELPLKQDDGKEYKVLQYDQTIGLLVEAIKELSARVEELENGTSK